MAPDPRRKNVVLNANQTLFVTFERESERERDEAPNALFPIDDTEKAHRCTVPVTNVRLSSVAIENAPSASYIGVIASSHAPTLS